MPGGLNSSRRAPATRSYASSPATASRSAHNWSAKGLRRTSRWKRTTGADSLIAKGRAVFHYGFVHAVLVDWAGHRQTPGFASALVETVSVLGGGDLAVEERLRL